VLAADAVDLERFFGLAASGDGVRLPLSDRVSLRDLLVFRAFARGIGRCHSFERRGAPAPVESRART